MSARVAGVLLLWEGRVLLQHRDDFPHIRHPGRWAFFGGHLEPGESPEDGALREIEEELGVRLPGPLRPVYAGDDGETHRTIFAADLPLPPATLVQREGQGMALFGPNDVEDDRLVPLHREILRAYFAGHDE